MMKRLLRWLLLLLFFNFTLLAPVLPGAPVAALMGIALAVFYLVFNIRPMRAKVPQPRLRILNGGCELILAAMVCFTLEAALYLCLLLKAETEIYLPFVINALVCVILLLLMLLNGIVRVFACSTQLGILPRVLLVLFWWAPVVNLLLLHRYFSVSQKEYQLTSMRYERNADRKQEELCKTKYPLLMIHGIFFRDWKAFNYWGRIPQELAENGATIYYGSHQSSASVERCAEELKQCLLELIEQTGCEKVNIIAHSKGGLDARYLVSRLGMGRYVASLTTINTPHLGCNYVGTLLDLIPNKAIAWIGKKYESLFVKLGDDDPDFFSGLRNLTDRECARLNALMQDDPAVCYQSVGARMRSWSSAMFPLNVGYGLIKLFSGGENDGLVSTDSMVWGDFLGVLSTKGRQGISHGDMIDLTRKDIEGFDVCEFYVDLVNNLKQKGF